VLTPTAGSARLGATASAAVGAASLSRALGVGRHLRERQVDTYASVKFPSVRLRFNGAGLSRRRSSNNVRRCRLGYLSGSGQDDGVDPLGEDILEFLRPVQHPLE
jgi:hypothetical protein